MKKLLNMLYVTQQGLYLHKDGETVVVERNGQTLARLPVHNLNGIVVFGNSSMSPYLMNFCSERGLSVSYFTEHGKFLARVEGPVSGNVHLRVAQMRAYEDKARKTELARGFLIGKIINSRSILLRRIRDHGETESLSRAADHHLHILGRLREPALDVASLRGLEGEAASSYFAAFNDLLVTQKDRFSIEGRNRRPPRDPMNAILSYVYTLLAYECRAALEGVGLDSQIGYLHELRSGRPALALDLMEELRSVMADRVAVSLVNLKQVSAKDFTISESGAVTMSEGARKTLLTAWQKKKQEEIMHPFLGERIALGLVPHAQALLLARHLRGDLDAYPPFLQK